MSGTSVDLTIETCQFEQNAASALEVDGANANVVVRGSSFTHNGADDVELGGAVRVHRGRLEMLQCRFEENRGRKGSALAVVGADSVYVASETNFTGNRANDRLAARFTPEMAAW